MNASPKRGISSSILVFTMHPFPCSALLTCFGSVRENTPFDQPEPNCLAVAEVQKVATDSAVSGQPAAEAVHPEDPQGHEAGEGISPHRHGTEKNSSLRAKSSSSNDVAAQPVPGAPDASALPAEGMGCDEVTVRTQIPRPSIIGVPKVSVSGWSPWPL